MWQGRNAPSVRLMRLNGNLRMFLAEKASTPLVRSLTLNTDS